MTSSELSLAHKVAIPVFLALFILNLAHVVASLVIADDIGLSTKPTHHDKYLHI
jgi:hypothetical protein